MLVFSKVREFFVDSLELKLYIEEIKRRLANQDKNLELVFTYLDELIEKQKNPHGCDSCFHRNRQPKIP